MPVVQVVLALVVPTTTDMAVDVPVSLGAPALPAQVLATTVALPALAAPATLVASAGRMAPALAVAPMAFAAFTMAVAPAAPVQPTIAPTTPVVTPVVTPSPGATAVPPVGQSSSDAMV